MAEAGDQPDDKVEEAGEQNEPEDRPSKAGSRRAFEDRFRHSF